jgi:hypothetical protein
LTPSVPSGHLPPKRGRNQRSKGRPRGRPFFVAIQLDRTAFPCWAERSSFREMSHASFPVGGRRRSRSPASACSKETPKAPRRRPSGEQRADHRDPAPAPLKRANATPPAPRTGAANRTPAARRLPRRPTRDDRRAGQGAPDPRPAQQRHLPRRDRATEHDAGCGSESAPPARPRPASTAPTPPRKPSCAMGRLGGHPLGVKPRSSPSAVSGHRWLDRFHINNRFYKGAEWALPISRCQRLPRRPARPLQAPRRSHRRQTWQTISRQVPCGARLWQEQP